MTIVVGEAAGYTGKTRKGLGIVLMPGDLAGDYEAARPGTVTTYIDPSLISPRFMRKEGMDVPTKTGSQATARAVEPPEGVEVGSRSGEGQSEACSASAYTGGGMQEEGGYKDNIGGGFIDSRPEPEAKSELTREIFEQAIVQERLTNLQLAVRFGVSEATVSNRKLLWKLRDVDIYGEKKPGPKPGRTPSGGGIEYDLLAKTRDALATYCKREVVLAQQIEDDTAELSQVRHRRAVCEYMLAHFDGEVAGNL